MTRHNLATLAALAIFAGSASGALAMTPEQTKELVLTFNRVAFEQPDPAAVEKMLSSDFIEHHPPAGAPERTKAEFVGLIQRFAQRTKGGNSVAPPPTMAYAYGDTVLLVTRKLVPEPKDPTQTYEAFHFDLYRVNAQGQVAEHWDDAVKPPATAAKPG